MVNSTALRELRAATANKEAVVLLSGDNEVATIKDATYVKFGKNNDLKYPLDELTNLYIDNEPQTLKAVVFCWLHDKLSIVDYKNQCLEYGIPDFKFVVKTELTTWLNGNSDTNGYIREAEDSKETDGGVKSTTTTTGTISDDHRSKKQKADPVLDRIQNNERESIDHNSALRGTKNIDFGYLVKDANRYIQQLKKALINGKQSSGKHSSSFRSSSDNSNGPKKQPIIIVSPATTALLSLGNVKDFLEKGVFVEPSKSSSSYSRSDNIVIVKHNFENLDSAAQQIMVVDNVDLFTKPEYWDRVIAIFTTGQAWQFSKYKYSQPERLFQKYAGFYLGYLSDVPPKQIKDWNVHEIKVDRGDKRFRDKMIVKDFWAEIEKILLSKGYGKH
ncbi:accessory factor associated with RNA polymerase II [Scheffersomyces spartinae]|uniref:Accessory factor associated with RNA polymerase II n=1 Tax=Scheffersomyces spartinae TaxID=45513 RepID=A0A9P7V6T8_9ASCO|nr:accessory factor associated with RNA polymerase II [Scheffersomyces spartinae]KAG7192242.1 accessory factor associated with RNA polymerase II [Scheffersomyces spartinae]